MAVPADFVELRSRGCVAWVRQDLVDLGVDLLWEPVEPLAGAKGRGGVGTLQLRDDLLAVVRPFRRGGALGNLLGERYRGPARVRRELEVLAGLRAEGVPVVTPLAAVARRRRTFWRLRLLTEFAADAQAMPAFCAADPEAHRWAIEAAAVTCRLAFAAGLRHPDLHPDNLLVSRRGDLVRAALVDLDRAVLADPPTERQRDAMLVRMARYIRRHGRRLAVQYSTADHMRFLRGLGMQREERREAFPRLAQQLARAMTARKMIWKQGAAHKPMPEDQ